VTSLITRRVAATSATSPGAGMTHHAKVVSATITFGREPVSCTSRVH
jgi:hypothetical protein